MKTFLMTVLGALALLAGGCAAPSGMGGASEPGFEGGAQGRGSGQGTSEERDYGGVLADPGPF